ncbi:MAG TPA: hydroxyphenylacetyl-CoA thioesterase PaaI [Candidatus Acidoferrum sp.]|jgi:acyl-CoA thioesterase|nr:hydroxyphenylacetyl-CoA thioesterase PaaI [Candidatus Acidoferrum sp.]
MIDAAQSLAEQCAQAMYSRDRASQSAGMTIDAVAPGYAKLSMTLVDAMINGHHTAHGGAIFALADSAFAFACNSRNVASVAQHCSITFVTPGREGERLLAECRETNLTGRFGIYDVTVTGGDGRVVAIFRGHSAAVRGDVLNGKDPW